MNSRVLTSFFMIAGPILMLIMWGIVYPNAGSDSGVSGEIAEVLDNVGRAKTAGVIGSLAFMAVLIGYRNMANTLSETTDGIGSQLAGLAGVLATVSAAAIVVQVGLSMAAMDLEYYSKIHAETLYLVGSEVGRGILMFWGIVLFLTGGVALYTGSTGEKNPIALLWPIGPRSCAIWGATLLTATGVLAFVGFFFANDSLSLATWMIVSIVTILTGILFYVQGRQSKAS